MSSFKAATSIHHHLQASLLPLWHDLSFGRRRSGSWTHRLDIHTPRLWSGSRLDVQTRFWDKPLHWWAFAKCAAGRRGDSTALGARQILAFYCCPPPCCHTPEQVACTPLNKHCTPPTPPHFYLTFYLAVTNERQLDYNIICLLFITGTKDTIH